MEKAWNRYAQQVCIEFGERLRRQRDVAGLKQIELAEQINLQRTSITNMENGKQMPSLVHVIAIAQALGIDPIELVPRVSIESSRNLEADDFHEWHAIRERVLSSVADAV